MNDNRTGKALLFSNLEEVWTDKKSQGNNNIEGNEDNTRKGDADYWVKYYANEQLKRNEINKVHRLAGELKKKNGSVTSVNMISQQQPLLNQQRRQLVFSRPFKPDSQARVLRAKDKQEELEKKQIEIGKQNMEKQQEINERNKEMMNGKQQEGGEQVEGKDMVELEEIASNNYQNDKEIQQGNQMKIMETTINLQLPLDIDKSNPLNQAQTIENVFEKDKSIKLTQQQQMQLVLNLQDIIQTNNNNNNLNNLIYLNNHSSIQLSHGNDTATSKIATTLPQSTSFEMINEYNSNNHLNLLLFEQIFHKHNNHRNTSSSIDKSSRFEGTFNEIKLEHVNGLHNKTLNNPQEMLSRTLFGRKSMSSALKFPISSNIPYIQETSQTQKTDSNIGSCSQRAAHRGQRFYTETAIIPQQSQQNQEFIGQDSVLDLNKGNNNVSKKLFLLEGSNQLPSSRNGQRDQNKSKISQNINSRPQSAFGSNNKSTKIEVKDLNSKNCEKQLKNKSIIKSSNNLNTIFGSNSSNSNIQTNNYNSTNQKKIGNLFENQEELAALSYSCQALNSSFEIANSKIFSSKNANFAKTMTNLNTGDTVNNIKISSNPSLRLSKNQQFQQQNYSLEKKPTKTNNFFWNYDDFKSLPNYQFQQKQQEQSKNLSLAVFSQPHKSLKQTEIASFRRPISASKGKVLGSYQESPVVQAGKVGGSNGEGEDRINSNNASVPVIKQGNQYSKLSKKNGINSSSISNSLTTASSVVKVQKHFTVIYKICNKNILSCGSKDTIKSSNNFSALNVPSSQ